jgi:hypothetical protein
VVEKVPLNAFSCLSGYAFIITEEVAGGYVVFDLVELVDVIAESLLFFTAL